MMKETENKLKASASSSSSDQVKETKRLAFSSFERDRVISFVDKGTKQVFNRFSKSASISAKALISSAEKLDSIGKTMIGVRAQAVNDLADSIRLGLSSDRLVKQIHSLATLQARVAVLSAQARASLAEDSTILRLDENGFVIEDDADIENLVNFETALNPEGEQAPAEEAPAEAEPAPAEQAEAPAEEAELAPAEQAEAPAEEAPAEEAEPAPAEEAEPAPAEEAEPAPAEEAEPAPAEEAEPAPAEAEPAPAEEAEPAPAEEAPAEAEPAPAEPAEATEETTFFEDDFEIPEEYETEASPESEEAPAEQAEEFSDEELLGLISEDFGLGSEDEEDDDDEKIEVTSKKAKKLAASSSKETVGIPNKSLEEEICREMILS